MPCIFNNLTGFVRFGSPESEQAGEIVAVEILLYIYLKTIVFIVYKLFTAVEKEINELTKYLTMF